MKYEPADIVIYLQDKGIVLKEKSLLAYEKESGKILAVGTEVEKLTERMSEDIVKNRTAKEQRKQGRIP